MRDGAAALNQALDDHKQINSITQCPTDRTASNRRDTKNAYVQVRSLVMSSLVSSRFDPRMIQGIVNIATKGKGKGKELPSGSSRAQKALKSTFLPKSGYKRHPLASVTFSAAGTATATATNPNPSSHTPPTMPHPRVWCILITSDNVLLGEPFPVKLDHREQVFDLKMKIQGEFMDHLAHVNISREMEVWRCRALICNNSVDEIREQVRNLEFPHDGEHLGGWLEVERLQLPDYEPLVVKVLHSLKGAQRPFHVPFPTEFSYVLNS
jgi:hypothetical protein